MSEKIESLLRDIRIQYRRGSIEPAVKMWANDRLRDLRPKYGRLLEDDYYEDFVLDYIQRERERFQARDADSLPDRYDEPRDEPLCTGGRDRVHECAIMRGELPRAIEEAGTLDRGVREFKRHHTGRPLVLVEAKREYYRFVGDVEHALREVLTALSNNTVPDETITVADATDDTVAQEGDA